MKILKQIGLFLALSITFFSCSDDDPATLDVVDFIASVDENQITNAVIGSVAATGTDGTFAYSITSQSPTGSIAIDASTGQITVADASVFDFETNPTITANVSVMGNSITETAAVTITLNDLDDLEFLLSDSKAAYTAANDGDWIVITEAEYNNLYNNLNNVSRAGALETKYNDTSTRGTTGSHPFTIANQGTEARISANEFVFAFKYYISSGTDITDLKVKLSETPTSGYIDLGNTFSAHSADSGKDVFFILKGNATTYTNESYLTFFKPLGVVIGYDSSGTTGYYYEDGDADADDNFITSSSGTAYYQALTTAQKQW